MRARRTALALTTAATALVALGGIAAPALAASHTTRDAAGDVVREVDTFDARSGDVSETTTPAPEHSDGDVTTMRVDHRVRRLVLTMRYASLARPAAKVTSFQGFSIRTSTGRNYDLAVVTSRRAPQGEREFARADGRSVRCRGLATKVDYAADTFRASIPTGCLSSPRWVRVGGAAGSFDGDLDGDSFTSYLDDAQRSGGIKDKLALGPRVRRG